MTLQEKREHLEKTLTNRTLFEQEVLDAHDAADRYEIMQLIAKRVVRERLKRELNFLFMQRLEQLTFAQVPSEMVKIFLDELKSYLKEVLYYPQELFNQEFSHADYYKVLSQTALAYYKHYQNLLFEEVVNTLYEAAEITLVNESSNNLINDFVASNYMGDRRTSAIYTSAQFFQRIRSAKNSKKRELSKIQLKMAEQNEKIRLQQLSEDEFIKSKELLKRYAKEEMKIKKAPLDEFDQALKRLKISIAEAFGRIVIL